MPKSHNKKFTKNKPFKSNKKYPFLLTNPTSTPKLPLKKKKNKISSLTKFPIPHYLFYLYKINHTPTKLNPTNQTPISNL